MTISNPHDSNIEERVRQSFARQKLMAMIGAVITAATPGEVVIELPFRDDLTQQHGFVHAGIITAIADTACGYAALSLMPVGAEVLSVEFKINLLSPAAGERMRARGRVIRAGRTLTVCEGVVIAVDHGREALVASMLATMITRRERAGALSAAGI